MFKTNQEAVVSTVVATVALGLIYPLIGHRDRPGFISQQAKES